MRTIKLPRQTRGAVRQVPGGGTVKSTVWWQWSMLSFEGGATEFHIFSKL